MTSLYINGIVRLFEEPRYPDQILRAAIPCSEAELERVKTIRDGINKSIPLDVRVDLFSRDTMSSWFRMTGVGLIPEKDQDPTTKLAIERSCKQKLREYEIEILSGKTARFTLMDHIFKEVREWATDEETMEIIAAMNRCSDVPYVQSFASRFCSWVITALRVEKMVAEDRRFKFIVALSIVGLGLWKYVELLSSSLLSIRIPRPYGPIIVIPLLFFLYIGAKIIPKATLLVSIVCLNAIELSTRMAHAMADAAYENNQLKRAYVTWMDATTGSKTQ